MERHLWLVVIGTAAFWGSGCAIDPASFSSDEDAGTVSEGNGDSVSDADAGSATGGEADSDTGTITLDEGEDVAYRLEGTIIVDGLLDEPPWHPTTQIATVTNAGGTVDDTVLFDILWDDTYLYIGLTSDDETLRNDSPASWNDDSVDLTIDGNHNRGEMDEFDDHCVLPYGAPEVACKSTDNTAPDGVLYAWQDLPEGGYSMEMAIPWTHIGISPQAESTIGFDIGVNDDDGDLFDTNRDNQFRWNGDTDQYWEPDLYGVVFLLE